MQVKISGRSGFCFGVKRAIKIAEKTLLPSKGRRDIYSLGSIIHNPQVVRRLSERGLRVITDIENVKSGTVIISSHGAPVDIIKKIRSKRLKLVDATCPFVKNAHNIVKGLKAKGYDVIIIGDKKHPEVKALLSLAGSCARTGSKAAAKKKKIAFVSQTTQTKDNYLRGIFDALKGDFSEARIFNTICNDTSQRQELAKRLLKECDVMLIIGGRNSANTRRLWQICKESGVDSYHIETDKELKRKWFIRKRCAGVVSGASTPDETVENAVHKIKNLTKER